MTCSRFFSNAKYVIKTTAIGLGRGLVYGVGLASLGYCAIRDYAFVDIMTQEYGHNCHLSFPGYLCDSNMWGSDDTQSYVRATIGTFEDNYRYMGIVICGVTTLNTVVSVVRACHRICYQTNPDYSPISTRDVVKYAGLGGLQGAIESTLLASGGFYFFREFLALCDLSLTSLDSFMFRNYNNEARSYFMDCAPYFIAGYTVYSAGKNAFDNMLYRLDDWTRYVITKLDQGFSHGTLMGTVVSILAILPGRDYMFSNLMEKYGHPCPLSFPAGFSCETDPEYNDFAFLIAIFELTKKGIFYYAPTILMCFGAFEAGKIATKLHTLWRKEMNDMAIPVLRIAPEVRISIDEGNGFEYKQLPDAPEFINSPSLTSKEMLTAAARGGLKGSGVGAFMSYLGFYVTREVFFYKAISMYPPEDAAFRSANTLVRQYSDSAIPSAIVGCAFFGAAIGICKAKCARLSRSRDERAPEEHKVAAP